MWHIPAFGDRLAMRRAVAMVEALRRRHPDLVVLPAHDPTAAARLAESERLFLDNGNPLPQYGLFRIVVGMYTHGHHESVLRSHRWRTAANSAAYLLPHLKRGQSLLDVGCGPGTVTVDLAERVAPGRVTALELTADALELARPEAASRSCETIDFVVGDVHALDFPDQHFDVVHAHQVLQHVADPVAGLRELRRVCRPDGVMAVRDSDYAAFTWFPLLPELDEWLDLYRRVARSNGGEPDAGRRLHSWALAAGFRTVTATSSTWCYSSAEERAWWGGMWADRIIRSDLAGMALSRGLATEADLARISDGWRRWAAAPDGWLSILHGEVLANP